MQKNWTHVEKIYISQSNVVYLPSHSYRLSLQWMSTAV